MGFFIFTQNAIYDLLLHLLVCLIGGLSKIILRSTYLYVIRYYSALCTVISIAKDLF